MKYYKLSFIKNIKKGFLSIPLGIFTVGFVLIVLGDGVDFWQEIVLIIFSSSLGLPGLLIHIRYLWHDKNKRISYDSKNNYFDYEINEKVVRIYKAEIKLAEKIHRDVFYCYWGQYMMFKIRLNNDETYSITNLSIEFDDFYDLVKTKDRPLTILNTVKLI